MDTCDLPKIDPVTNPRLLTDEEYKIWLKGYLDIFYVYFTEDEEKLLKGLLPVRTTAYLKGTNKALKKVVAALLFLWNYQDYRYLTVSDLVSMYLGKAPDGDVEGDPQRRSHLDTSTPLLILHHLAYVPPNKLIDNLILHAVSERANRGLATLVLDETNLSEVTKGMRNLDLTVIDEGMDFFLTKAGKNAECSGSALRKESVFKNDPISPRVKKDPLADD